MKIPLSSRRLLIVVNDLGFFLSHRLPIAEAADGAGWDVHLATAPDPSLVPNLPDFLTHHDIPVSRSSIGIGEFWTVCGLYRVYRKVRPAVVHNVTVKPVVYGGIVARLTRVPGMIGAVSGLGYVFAGTKVRQRLLRAVLLILYRHAMRHPNSRIIFQNSDDRGLLERAGALNIAQAVIIPGSGVDLSKFQPTSEPNGVPTILMSARLLREKGVFEFAEAARIVREELDCRFLLAGGLDPENPSALTRSDLGPWLEDGTLEWLGHRKDVPKLLEECNIYTLPSYYSEGVPKSLIEAAAAGRALITTNMPGCRDVVTHGVNGLLVPPRDVEALAKAILSLLRNDDLRRRMGHVSRKRAEKNFSIEHVVRRHLELYEELLDAAGERRS